MDEEKGSDREPGSGVYVNVVVEVMSSIQGVIYVYNKRKIRTKGGESGHSI